MNKYVVSISVILIIACVCPAVTSKIVKHGTLDDFSNGKTENTIISSRGTISLSQATQTLAKDFNDVWTINSIVSKDENTVFIGTSPNGQIFRYKDGKITCLYPEAKTIEPNSPAANARTHLKNEHVFKLALDSDGNLLAGISGEKGRVMRYDGKKFETIFEANDSPYIFAITLDKSGNIFLGTGPKGQIWQLDSKGRNPKIVYACQDKNVLSLVVGKDGSIYAGTDTRGLIYKINPEKKTASVLYDSDENEINDLLFDKNGNLYAAATSYKSIKAQLRGASVMKKPFALGKPEETEPQEEEPSEESASDQSESLKIANTPIEESFESKPMPAELIRGKQSTASHIYKIDSDGFVTEVFSRNAVFFKIFLQKDQILLGTGNKAELFSINPETEIEALYYEDSQASQITDITKLGSDVIFATANPPKLIKLKSDFAATGEFQSSLIDAGQPAMWGKLQIEADIPSDTQILLSARSGNVSDINDPTFSTWTEPVKLTGATDLNVPLARFCQYKLILNGSESYSPVVREVAAAYVIPNLAPKVTEITVRRTEKKSDPGLFKIDFKAVDENQDRLIYNIDFRMKGRKIWIELTKDSDKPVFDWDSKTAEDGIYEFKVTASDSLSNNADTALTGSRVSDPVIVDNTAPAIEKHQLKITDKTAILNLQVSDRLSTINTLAYTIDSNEKWNNVLPDDNVFDTDTENFTIKTQDLQPGQHIIAVRISDAVDNTMYKTFEVEIK
ncbi:MAG: hypothetical protein A2Y10_19125 [Planctomycetes bacterium GWF2_41_51]|nr:MAG: hypothetical protein A2Y10_19125 [Planctomycetes bacterium GWF2_41_51]HBG27418.1 hypothetical protein [Phycisphaerales bacterium]